MPSFSEKSKAELGTCHRDLIAICNEVIKHLDFSVVEGERDELKQNLYFSQGRSKIKYPYGKHNKTPSMAVDIIPYPTGYGDVKVMILLAGWMKATAQRLFEIGAISHRLRWGGDWDSDGDLNDQTFNDYPHFELEKVSGL